MAVLFPSFPVASQAIENSLPEFCCSLAQIFGTAGELTATAGQHWNEGKLRSLPDKTAGIFLVFTLPEGGGYLLAIPETLPLPDWIHSPDDRQQLQLQQLANHWAQQIFPDHWAQCEATAVTAQDLSTAIRWSSPTAEAWLQVLPFRQGTAANESGDEADSPALWFIGPVESPPAPRTLEDFDETEDETEEHSTTSPCSAPQGAGPQGAGPQGAAQSTGGTTTEPADAEEMHNRVRRLLPLNVTISVRLAEMKIELASLINLCPGTLFVFPKSCDDLLDLYVNNQRYAQGEAVKIGEKFGLKINQVGGVKPRKSGVFTL